LPVFGLLIIIISNFIPYSFISPNEKKYIVTNKTYYYKCFRIALKTLGFLFILSGFLLILDNQFYILIIILSTPLTIIILNNKLKKLC
ncbi:hypothetical protein, partial [Clostridium sp. HCS.1]|uniref:hypothetical protein n=1 Tax=Clostridium sp. HCS.1 TaxID=3238594 RepID=UPI003A0FF8AB